MAKSTKRLLLADDSTTVQKVVNLTFADEGIEVVTVSDGDAAMEKFVEATPDLVMVDVNMPGTGGYKICEIIKQDDETKHIPVILLVGSFESFDEAEAKRVGADDYLTKPFQSIRHLVAKVSALLDPNAAVFDDDDRTDFAAADNNNPARFNDLETGDQTIQTNQTNQIGSLPANEAQKFSADESAEDSPQISSGKLFEHSFTSEAAENLSKTQFLTLEDSGAATDTFADRRETAPHISPDEIEQIASRVVEKLSDKLIKEMARAIVPQLSQSIAEELSQEKRKHGQ